MAQADHDVYPLVITDQEYQCVLKGVVNEFYAQNGFGLCAEAVLKLRRLIDHCERHLIANLLQVASALDEHHQKAAVAQIAGASTGIAGAAVVGAGGIIALVGVVIAPVTFGTSAIAGGVLGGAVAGLGGAVTAAGTTTAAGAKVVKKSLIDGLLKRAQSEIDQHDTYKKDLMAVWNRIDSMCYDISVQYRIFGAEAVCKFLWTIYNKANQCDVINNCAVIKKCLNLSKVLTYPLYAGAITAVVVGTGTVAFNLFALVESAIVVGKKECHPVATEIRENTVVQLQDQLIHLKTLLELVTNKAASSGDK